MSHSDKYLFLCVGSLMNISVECRISRQSSNSSLVYCIHYHTNAPVKGMNGSLFLQAVGSLAMGRNRDREVKLFDWIFHISQ